MDIQKYITTHFSKLFMAIILLATFLRVITLGVESIWIDEATTLYYAQKSFIQNINWVAQDTNVPLYNVLLWMWIKLFGTTEVAIRSLSVLFGIASVVVTGLIAKKFFSKKVALYACLFLTLSQIHIFYSQEARNYTTFITISLVSVYWYLHLLTPPVAKKVAEKKTQEAKQQNSTKDYIYYTITTIPLLYTHPFWVFILFVQNITYIINKQRKDWVKWICSQAILAMCFLPWLPTFLSQTSRVHKYFWISTPSIKDIVYTFSDFSGGPVVVALWAPMIMCTVYSIYKVKYTSKTLEGSRSNVKKRNENKKNKVNVPTVTFLLSLIIVPILLVFLASQITRPLYHTRYFIFALPAWVLLASYAFEYLEHRSKKIRKLIPLLLALTIISLTFHSVTSIITPEKPDWRSTASFLEKNAKGSEVIILQPYYELEPFSYYARRDCFDQDVYYCSEYDIPVFGVSDSASLEEKWQYIKDSPVWLVGDPKYVDPEKTVFNKLKETRTPTKKAQYHGIPIFYFSETVE